MANVSHNIMKYRNVVFLSTIFVFITGCTVIENRNDHIELDAIEIKNKYKNIAFEKMLEEAKQGKAEAQWYVGVEYIAGDRIKKDIPKGVYWLELSANQNYIMSNTHLGFLLCIGRKVPKDCKKGLKYLKRAAPYDSDASIFIGEIYARGVDVTADREMAIEWFSKAKSQESPVGKYWLGLMYHGWFDTYIDYKKSIPLFREAANEGLPDAQYHLGYAYYAGEGVEKNINTAIKWMEISANNGYCIAQYVLAGYYANGIGVKQNIVKAYDLAKKAVKGGCEDRDKLYQKLEEDVTNQALKVGSLAALQLTST